MWQDTGKNLLVVGFTLTAFSTLIVAARLYTRLVRPTIAGLSDYLIIVALISAWTNTVLNYYQTEFGKDARLNRVEDNPNLPQVQAALLGTRVTWFLYRPFYIVTLSFIKLSILTFYYKTLLPASSPSRSFRSYRCTVYLLIAFTILYSLAMVAASVFQCTPISAAYSISGFHFHRHSKLPQQRCYDPTTLWLVSAIINFATDVVIFMLPIPIIFSLQNMPRRKRVGLFCILSVGTLAIAASAIRMWILMLWGKNMRSRSKYGTELLLWGQVEINCGIIGASAMFLRPLLRQWLRRRSEPVLKTFDGAMEERGRAEPNRGEGPAVPPSVITVGTVAVPDEKG